ncbi:stomatin-like protein [Trichosporon asahii var. asahii CBS 8904]|uniref:Stomatin-like protein n=1 Tax=Trichosporon asahii var. asahii (strain CBS 8904) TaxID=1220162 RepID=K1VFL9_TRIAC|nr:stomatin-like protein [Trichosporon asahii var. asahii CBS 8904]
MSSSIAPSYNHATNNSPPALQYDDNELHRYVTDDGPSHSKAPVDRGVIPPQPALIPLRKADMQPSYAQDLGSGTVTHGFYGSMMTGIGACIGAFYKSVDPGLVQVNVCSEDIRMVDVKIQLTTVPPQTVQTKDNVSVIVDSVISWHIVSPYRAAFGINNLTMALVERAQTTLRQVVGGRVLQSVISDREGLAQEVAEIIETTAEKWGVSIESILLKDINFSVELQQSLSSAATQKRIGESKVIAARAEVDAAKLMRQVVFVPMNLGVMGAGGEMNQQLIASVQDAGDGQGHGHESGASRAGLLNSMASM